MIAGILSTLARFARRAPPPPPAEKPTTDWAQIREFYRNYPCETLSYATVRDFCDSADHLPQLLRFNSDLKDVQRPWAVKAILSRLDPGASLIEIGGGESRPSAALEALGYRPTVVDPCESPDYGPVEFKRIDDFRAAHPNILFVPTMFTPDLTGIAPASADCIFSVSVLEHIHDQGPLFEAIDKFLKPGGWSIHCIDVAIEGAFQAFSEGMACGVLERQRKLAGLPEASDEYAALVDKLRSDIDAYFLGPQGFQDWRFGKSYDEFPYQKFASIQTCVRKRL